MMIQNGLIKRTETNRVIDFFKQTIDFISKKKQGPGSFPAWTLRSDVRERNLYGQCSIVMFDYRKVLTLQ